MHLFIKTNLFEIWKPKCVFLFYCRRPFDSHVTFDEQSYLHFQYGAFTVLLFKCG